LTEMEQFPAVFIGGPPHSGKSVLTYSLTRALRQRGIEHYVIRAAPDGEGDWASEADQHLVRTLRSKGAFTQAFTDFVCESLAKRHLPLLVDAGGRPTPYQERIFDCCTHAVLLTPDADSLAHWRAIAERHGVPIVAELTSRLQGSQSITATEPVLQGVITDLDRGRTATGPTFDALVDRLADILYVDPDELYRLHERRCSVETIIHLGRLARILDAPMDGNETRWEPQHVPRVLDYLPEKTPLALYGRGPNWLYTAVALLTFPAPFVQFDPRLDWVEARPLQIGHPGSDSPMQFRLYDSPDYVHVQVLRRSAHLEYDDLDTWCVPPIPARLGIILSGKLPLWLYTSLALTYRTAPWIAVYQPQVGAVVVYSTTQAHAIGDCIQLRSPTCIPPTNTIK
jgi:CRISPR-associated protein Csx3